MVFSVLCFRESVLNPSCSFWKIKSLCRIVLKVHQDVPTVYEAKEIEHILDESPIIRTHQLKFWSWIASYYLCSKGEVMRAALPSVFLLESETIIQLRENISVNEEELQDDQFLIYKALQHNSLLKLSEIINI